MTALGIAHPNPAQSVEPEAFRDADVSLDFSRRRFRIGNQTSTALTDLPGVSFSRASSEISVAKNGSVHTFSENVPRITDLGLYVSHPDVCWIDLTTPLASLTMFIEFDRSGWSAGVGYLNAVRVVRQSDERDAAALFNDHVADNVVRYRVDVNNTLLLGPANLGAFTGVTSAVLSIGPSACSLTTNESAATGPGSTLGGFNRVYVGRRDAAGGPMIGFIRKLVLWPNSEAYQL